MDGDSLDAFSKNNIVFITLNYDRSLEFELTRMLSNTWGAIWEKAAEVVRTIKIIHLHGSLGPLPDHEQHYGAAWGVAEILKAWKGILTLGEPGSEKEYEAGKECIRTAQMILCLGFGYHQETIDKLGLRGDNLAVYGTCQGLTQSEVHGVTRQFAPRPFHELLRDGVTWNHKPHEPGPAVDYLRANVEKLI